MAEIHETLHRLLENPKLQEVLADAFNTGVDSPSEFEAIGLADHIRHARGIVDEDSPFKVLRVRVQAAFELFVIDQLPQPAAITLDDLTSIAIAQLAGVPLRDSFCEESFAHAYRRFVTFSLFEIEMERYGEWFDFGFWEGGMQFETLGEKSVLWSSPSGFRLCLMNPIVNEDDWSDAMELDLTESSASKARMRGYCTERAYILAEYQLKRVITSIVESIELSSDVFVAIGNDKYWKSNSQNFLICGDGRHMLSACLSARWRVPGSSDDVLLDRLHNATLLLSQADQVEDPIALSLSFGAIEALICEEGELPVNKQIKRHVTTLLVQDVASRKAKEKLIDKLYDIRCDVMHGTKVQASRDASKAVRRIAAGVIRAVSCWRENQQRVGGESTWKELLDELNAASRKPGIVVGVPDLADLIPSKVPS